MDSLHFFQHTIWNIDRDEADARLAAVLAWVGTYAQPDCVFTPAKLAEWATMHGYLQRDTTELVALLKQAQQWAPRDTVLASRLQETIHALGGWTG